MRCVVPSLSDAAVVWAGGRGDSIARLAARLDAVTAGSSITACDVRHPRFADHRPAPGKGGRGRGATGRRRAAGPAPGRRAGEHVGAGAAVPAPRTAARPGGARAVSADPPGGSSSSRAAVQRSRRASESCSHHGVPRSPRPCLAAPTRARAAASAASSSARFAVRTAERAVPRWCSNRARTGSGSSGSAARHRLPPTTIHRPSGVRGAGTHASCQAVPCCAGVPRANLDIRCPGSTLSRCG